MVEGRRIDISGIVQGVGFRPWVYRTACADGVRGRVWNDERGVTIEAFGTRHRLDRFERHLTQRTPTAAVIAAILSTPIPLEEVDEFQIVATQTGRDRHVSIPADLATCPSCEREITSRSFRRYRYPFTNCTECGPRFTIATDVPYDRAQTTMARFVMCPACQREYEAPGDRRFHAQPNACPVCGPRLQVVRPNGDLLDCEDPIAFAARALRAGLIVALKGIGGFHLACDATAEDVVARLRIRKHRDEKPLAVMVRTLKQAEALAIVNAAEAALLTGRERPIVLLQRREPTVLAFSISPGNPLVGLMLPYSPLHHLLLADTRRPLVMTSGNLSDEPIAYTNQDAVQRLGPIADLLLVHDRDIVTRCDDSVARVIAGAPVVLRRSRGYVPRAIGLPYSVERPVLACGPLLKNTFCLVRGKSAYFGPHIGDLDHLETFRSYESSIERMQRFLDITPEVIAYDLHPGYHSTQYALARTERVKVGVQHHHAHVASLMAEDGLTRPIYGVAYDGTGYGTDGSAWGGEILHADYSGFERLATFRPILLAGGDAAIHEPWRIALALLVDAFDGDVPADRLSLFQRVRANDLRVVRQMLDRQLQVSRAHGVGRYFDAIGALLLERRRSSYEGQVAAELNALADSAERGEYPFDLCQSAGLIEIDLRRGVRALVNDLLAGQSPARLAARFHRTIGAATAAAIDVLVRLLGRAPIGLTGGCFQNALLATDIATRLGDYDVLMHGAVPPGDGGIALGQAIVADAIARQASA
jgi:hydrogenase maturation protein HypF